MPKIKNAENPVCIVNKAYFTIHINIINNPNNIFCALDITRYIKQKD